jgi:hypothetical protein
MDQDYASKLKMEAALFGISNAALSTFEIMTGKNGMISALVGAGTLAYGLYKYSSDSAVLSKNRNVGDEIADFFDTGVDAAGGILQGAGFLGGHLYLAGAVVGGGILLYFMSGMVKVDAGSLNLSPSTIPAIAGAGMGLGGSYALYLDAQAVQSAKQPDLPHDIAHAVVENVTEATAGTISTIGSMFTAKGWQTAGDNITHPGQYFSNYGRRISNEWSDVHDVGSFFNTWGDTMMILGDTFTTVPQATGQENAGAVYDNQTESYAAYIDAHPNATSAELQTEWNRLHKK